MPALAALSVPTWQSLMTQRLNLAPSRDVVALCAAATAGVAKPAMPALISIRRVREVGSIDVLLCGWPRGILNAARRRARRASFKPVDPASGRGAVCRRPGPPVAMPPLRHQTTLTPATSRRGRAAWPALQGRADAGLARSPLGRRDNR